MNYDRIEIMVGVFVIAGLLCVGYLTVKLGRMEIIGGNHYKLTAQFENVTGLKPGASVEIAGVQVGQVASIALDQQILAASVQLKIRNQIQLSDDTIASIKTAGLIGDKFVSLSPGGSDNFLTPGDTIVDTESTIDFEKLISQYIFGNVK
jgi:phospholipid/cholesterol/gamma-HCH transport system substrate-binding protein